MSSDPITRRFALLALLGLAGCGLTPVYGTDSGLRGKIGFASDDSVAGFRLQERLEDRLGFAPTPVYTLQATPQISQRAAAITAEGDTARYNLIGAADWVLRDAASGARIDAGTVEAFTSYSATGTTVATQTTRDDAEARLAVILADLIVSHLMALNP